MVRRGTLGKNVLINRASERRGEPLARFVRFRARISSNKIKYALSITDNTRDWVNSV